MYTSHFELHSLIGEHTAILKKNNNNKKKISRKKKEKQRKKKWLHVFYYLVFLFNVYTSKLVLYNLFLKNKSQLWFFIISKFFPLKF